MAQRGFLNLPFSKVLIPPLCHFGFVPTGFPFRMQLQNVCGLRNSFSLNSLSFTEISDPLDDIHPATHVFDRWCSKGVDISLGYQELTFEFKKIASEFLSNPDLPWDFAKPFKNEVPSNWFLRTCLALRCSLVLNYPLVVSLPFKPHLFVFPFSIGESPFQFEDLWNFVCPFRSVQKDELIQSGFLNPPFSQVVIPPPLHFRCFPKDSLSWMHLNKVCLSFKHPIVSASLCPYCIIRPKVSPGFPFGYLMICDVAFVSISATCRSICTTEPLDVFHLETHVLDRWCSKGGSISGALNVDCFVQDLPVICFARIGEAKKSWAK